MKPIRALMLPNKASIRVDLIAQVVAHAEGVGILNDRNRMIGWIEIYAQDEAVRADHFDFILETLNKLVNNPRQAEQPDWSRLHESAL